MEKTYVLSDDKYFGRGYFIIVEENGDIKRFLKMSSIGQDLCMCGFDKDSYDKDYMTFRSIDFAVDENSNLYSVFSELYNFIGGTNVFTIDRDLHGDNHICMSRENNTITLTLSKDVWKGSEVQTDFIFINFGDMMIGNHFMEFYNFYKDLAKVSIGSTKEEFISKVLKLS